MALFRHPPWPSTVAEARRIQVALRRRLSVGGGPRTVRLVAGADCAFSADGGTIFAGIAVVALPGLDPVATAWAKGRVTFPYVPGYLSFREGPVFLRAARRLRVRPDLWLFDGQGIAHPRGFGLAAHLGVLLDRPSVGCAKSRLVGEHVEPPPGRGGWAPLMFGGRRVGAVLRTRDHVRPLYVSVGHRISLAAAIRWVLACCAYRVPEPIRLAEQLVNRLKRSRRRPIRWCPCGGRSGAASIAPRSPRPVPDWG
ncbi:MAG: endonuclease V [Candidatus Rokubacteria bacterium]|nr:endonuclease V [Candidatus Rokubacteria bacterium]MBI2552972.1 endonuclease V [Candidatus Rokubacteria bacterium]